MLLAAKNFQGCVRSGAILFALMAGVPCLAQRSGAASVTLTATLGQSLSFSVHEQSRPEPGSFLSFVEDAAPSPSLDVEASWVRGPGAVSVREFVSAAPGEAPQEILAPRRFDLADESDFVQDRPAVRLNVESPEAPMAPGSQLIIRAQAI